MVVWLPASAGELGDRPFRVRTVEDPVVENETVLTGLAAIGAPVAFLLATQHSLTIRLAAALCFGVPVVALFLFTRHGLYLSRAGVRVWRGILPKATVPWSAVDDFCLTEKRVLLGRRGSERLAVRLLDGTLVSYPQLNRSVSFERDALPVSSAKVRLRSFPVLVDQLNAIRDELR